MYSAPDERAVYILSIGSWNQQLLNLFLSFYNEVFYTK